MNTVSTSSLLTSPAECLWGFNEPVRPFVTSARQAKVGNPMLGGSRRLRRTTSRCWFVLVVRGAGQAAGEINRPSARAQGAGTTIRERIRARNRPQGEGPDVKERLRIQKRE
jgi:hypothetical protein